MTTFVLVGGQEGGDIDPAFNSIVKLSKNGKIVSYRGDVYVYIPSLKEWSSIASREAQVFLLGIIGAVSATVNYTTALRPYIKALEQYASPVSGLPSSVCIAGVRLEVSLLVNRLIFRPCTELRSNNNADVRTFCVLPIKKRGYFSAWEF